MTMQNRDPAAEFFFPMTDKKPSDKSPTDPKKPDGSGSGGGPNKPGPPNFFSRGVMSWIILAGLLALLLVLMSSQQNQAIEKSWQEFYAFAKNGQFDGPVVLKDDKIVGTLKKGTPGISESQRGDGQARVSADTSPQTKTFYLERLNEAGQDVTEDPGGSVLMPLLVSWGPVILIAFLIYFFFFRTLRNAGGGPGGMLGSFGRSKHKVLNKEHSDITLTDVAGVQEAKEEVTEIIEFLKDPKKFQRLGGRVPRGVLLMGAPGCGKTLLAKAVAGEADVPFFSISGSDFVEMFVGVGASRVRDLFKQAKENSPCIIFLDEIDAVGRRRGGGFSSGGHDEREQTLNAILVEMDGFDSSDQVIVIAATNRGDILDPALTRPGRFDRQISVPLPDVRGRMEILKVHSRKVKMSPDVDLERLARGTPMFSGAELAAIINEAAIAATMQEKEFVEMDDLEEARDKVRFGRSYKSRKVQEKERVATAYHEAGHAVLQYLLPEADPLHKVTIIPRGQSMGATFSLPEDDRNSVGRRYIHDTMRVLCGGRIAEGKKTGDETSGAAMDIRMVTSYARHMVLEWGMSDRLGFVDYTPSAERDPWTTEKVYSEETAKVIDTEIRELADAAFDDARRMVEEHWEQVEAVAQALLVHESLTFDEVERLMKGEKLSKPTVGDLIKAEQERSRQAEGEQAKGEKASAGDGEEPDVTGPLPSPA